MAYQLSHRGRHDRHLTTIIKYIISVSRIKLEAFKSGEIMSRISY